MNLQEAKTKAIMLAYKKARTDFHTFCLIQSGQDMYNEPHLIELCEFFQNAYESGEVRENLMVNLPPSHYKTYTLILFSAWLLGVRPDNKIVYWSYGQSLSERTSKAIREILETPKYKLMFPNTKLKTNDSAVNHWAIANAKGQFVATSIGGAITGKRGNILLIDDSIKDSEIANSMNQLIKIQEYYNDSMMDRMEQANGKMMLVLLGTMWSKADLFNYLEPFYDWKVYRKSAYLEDEDRMLCPRIISRDNFETQKKVSGNSPLFQAKFMNVLVSTSMQLYNIQVAAIPATLERYLPTTLEETLPYHELERIRMLPSDYRMVSTTDPIDGGKDYFVKLIGVQDKVSERIYLIDAVYATGIELRDIYKDEARYNVKYNCESVMEINMGSTSYFQLVKNEMMSIAPENLLPDMKYFREQGKKETRIINNSILVNQKIVVTPLFAMKHPRLWNDIKDFNLQLSEHDDAADCLTMMIQHFTTTINRDY